MASKNGEKAGELSTGEIESISGGGPGAAAGNAAGNAGAKLLHAASINGYKIGGSSAPPPLAPNPYQ